MSASYPIPLLEAAQVVEGVVVRTVNDAQVLTAPALNGGLQQSLVPLRDEVEGLNDHALATGARHTKPPVGRRLDASLVGGIDDVVGRSPEELLVRGADGMDRLHMPDVVLVYVHRPSVARKWKGANL